MPMNKGLISLEIHRLAVSSEAVALSNCVSLHRMGPCPGKDIQPHFLELEVRNLAGTVRRDRTVHRVLLVLDALLVLRFDSF